MLIKILVTNAKPDHTLLDKLIEEFKKLTQYMNFKKDIIDLFKDMKSKIVVKQPVINLDDLPIITD